MKHAIRPFEEQNHIPTFDGKPTPTAIELNFPETFGSRAWNLILDLEGTIGLYLFQDRFIVTDESCELTQPRWSGDTLEALEAWLGEQVKLKDAEEPGWEKPYLPEDMLAGGEQRTVTSLTFERALRIALKRGFKRFEFSCGGLSNDIEEYLKDPEDDEDDADYVLFADVIVRMGDAWGKDADVTRLLD